MRNRDEGPGLPWWRRAAAATMALLVLGMVAEGYVLSHRLHRVDLDLPGSGNRGTTFLVVGTDERSGLGGFRLPEAFGPPRATPGARADVITVVRVPGRGRPVSMSIPRDLIVVDRRRPARLALTRLRGLQPLVDALCRNLGVAPDHVVEITFAGLRRLVDAAGGMVIDEPHPARDRYTMFSVLAGRRRVDGEVAVSYVRSRHMEHLVGGRWVPDRQGVAGRERRQRELLDQLGRSARSATRNPLRAQRLAWEGTGALTVSRPTGLADLVRLGTALGRAEDLELPVERHDGAVPWAKLAPRADAVLERVAPTGTDGRATTCPRGDRARS